MRRAAEIRCSGSGPGSMLLLVAIGLGLGLLGSPSLGHERFAVKFQWNYINYSWPSEELYIRSAKDESYIEKNNVISGIKLWRGRMYLTIPRWRKGVPVTLASTSAVPINETTAPRLEAFPSWERQRIGDCSALQSVQSIEIDPAGRMWVLDSGRVASITSEAKPTCPPRLLIFDLERQPEAELLLSYEFPAEVASPESADLVSIVLEHEEGGWAYISDADDKGPNASGPGIILFSLANQTSWRFGHDSMRAKQDATGFIVEQSRVQGAFNIAGLALSPSSISETGASTERMLYYTPLSSYYIFSVPTRVLKTMASDPMRTGVNNNPHNLRLEQEVQVLGRKPSQTEGMIMSSTGVLYFGLLADDAVSKWDSKNPSFMTGQRIIARDHHMMQWPGAFAFDEQGQLWCITNRRQRFLDSSLSLDEPNFRAIVADTQMLDYQYYENGTSRQLPPVPAGAAQLAPYHRLGPLAALATLLIATLLIQQHH